MHFKTFKELKESLSGNVKIWPFGPGEQRLALTLQRDTKIECYSFDCPMKNGTTTVVSKRGIRLTNGDVVLIPPGALRALERANIIQSRPLHIIGDGPLDVVLKRTGTGITHYDAYIQYNDGYDDIRELGLLRGKADFSDPVKHYSEVAVHRSEAAICRCDIRDLMSTGHTPSCPEKRK